MSTQFTRDYFVEVALGNVANTSSRTLIGINTVIEGISNETVLANGFSGRYPFPSVAAQMDIVSTDANDTALGTGTTAVLVRGNIADGTELFEVVPTNGLTIVTTTNFYLRTNSILSASVGSNGVNAGTITLKNGTDLLANMVIGQNVSEGAFYSIPSDVRAIILVSSISTDKDNNGILNVHVFSTDLGGVDFTPLSIGAYETQVDLLGKAVFPIGPSTDIEFTGFAREGTGGATLIGQFELLFVEDTP